MLTNSDCKNKDAQDFELMEEAEIASVYISIHSWPNNVQTVIFQSIVIINSGLDDKDVGERVELIWSFFQQADTEQNRLYFKFQIEIL